MTDIEPFKLEHLEGFTSKNDIGDLANVMEANLSNPYREVASIMNDNKLICIAGYNMLRSNVGELWLIPSTEVKDCAYGFYKQVYNLIYNYCFRKLKRLEFAVDANSPDLIKWAYSLGFILEGRANNWDTMGNDHLLFARVQ